MLATATDLANRGIMSRLVRLLSEGERSVDELVKAVGVAQSTMSHHLQVLKDAGLVKSEKRGGNIYYPLTQPMQEP